MPEPRKQAKVRVAYKPVKVKANVNAPTKTDPFRRAENEDDDGYDPYSDRPAEREPLFEEDPWS